MAVYAGPPEQREPSKQRGFHLPGRQPFARDTKRRTHNEALYAYGEWSLFVLMWTLQDFNAGRVGRCSRCQAGGSAPHHNSEAIFDTFKQAVENRCPSCFGTTFEGGWKAKIVRPAIVDYSEERWDRDRRGLVSNSTGQVQSTEDFHLTDADYLFRGDGTRWRTQGGSTTTRLRDGFGTPSRIDSNLGYNYAQIVKLDKSSVAFDIAPVAASELTELLERVGEHFPPDFDAVDQIRGPILLEIDDHVPQSPLPGDRLPGRPQP